MNYTIATEADAPIVAQLVTTFNFELAALSLPESEAVEAARVLTSDVSAGFAAIASDDGWPRRCLT